MVFPTAFRLHSRPSPPWSCLLSLCPCSPAKSKPSLASSPPPSPSSSLQDTWHPLPYAPGEVSNLGLAQWSGRDGVVYVPRGYCCDEPCPVVVTLHGENSDAEEALSALLPFADEHRLLLAAPESRSGAWSDGSGFFNEDVAFIDKALDTLFENYCVLDSRIGVAGVSSGASFALNLGVRNGPVFSHVMAFSPTETETPCYEDGPEIFLSYARSNASDLMHACHKMIPRLKSCGYNCRVCEFDSNSNTTSSSVKSSGSSRFPLAKSQHAEAHCMAASEIPREVVASALDWFARESAGENPPSFHLSEKKGHTIFCGLDDSKDLTWKS